MLERHQIIIVGCGLLGSSLATKLSIRGYDVTVIDGDANALDLLGEGFSGFSDVGDGTNPEVLERDGIKEASYVLSFTNNDNDNTVVAELAKRIYGVEHVYARLRDEHKARLLEPYGIEILCPRRLCEQRFAAMSGIEVPGDDEL